MVKSKKVSGGKATSLNWFKTSSCVGSFASETSETDVELPGLVKDEISAHDASVKTIIKISSNLY